MIEDWVERTLCADGACTGVVDPSSGVCRVCGHAMPLWGDERRRGQVPAALDDDEPAPADRGQGGVDDERALCPDGACIGVIGSDGTCGECGRRAPVRVVPPKIARRDDDDDDGDVDGDGDGDRAAAGDDGHADGDDDDRRLCPDGACVGLLDAAAVCRVCGATDTGN